ncbi:SsgA family sporulation/cell division regulator [Streptomyces sp. Act143]|uniref:SsgA family sporulation/cell division regulator n=1 Tax=Streptomyces sp. Act143 TaxID=2200760 RepID=UPI000D67E39E|nr:SsgA family sporulation/cell division regulator [Streptomyces sp. Act143]PWI19379.1 SsgA family sporulation/cell division regulator [Streptomyces sp. Act143]
MTAWPPAGDNARQHETVLVEQRLLLELVLRSGEKLPLPARLTYDRNDPLAARLDFPEHADSIREWVFARNLLAAGMHALMGRGDVRIWPLCVSANDDDGEPRMRIQLGGLGAVALLEAPVPPVRAWLERTWKEVPLGKEHEWMDWDLVLARLLDEQ